MPSETVEVANGKASFFAGLLNSGKISVYSGTPPANVDTALSGNTLLGQLTYGATAFGTAASSAVTANAITSATAVATGTATFFRLFKSDGTTVVLQGTVGTSGSELNLNSTSIITGGNVAITSQVYTQQR